MMTLFQHGVIVGMTCTMVLSFLLYLLVYIWVFEKDIKRSREEAYRYKVKYILLQEKETKNGRHD